MKVFMISFLLAAFVQVNEGGPTGFFLALDNTTNCKPIPTLDGQNEFCITDEAIIKESEFKVDGVLQDDLLKKTQYFNLRFSQSGFETLKLICEKLPEKKLLFVVNGKVVGAYDNKKFKPSQIIPISGISNSKEIKWVYEALKKPH